MHLQCSSSPVHTEESQASNEAKCAGTCVMQQLRMLVQQSIASKCELLTRRFYMFQHSQIHKLATKCCHTEHCKSRQHNTHSPSTYRTLSDHNNTSGSGSCRSRRNHFWNSVASSDPTAATPSHCCSRVHIAWAFDDDIMRRGWTVAKGGVTSCVVLLQTTSSSGRVSRKR